MQISPEHEITGDELWSIHIDYLDNGWCPLAIPPKNGKRSNAPMKKGWQNTNVDTDQDWSTPNTNLGIIIPSDVVVLDIENKEKANMNTDPVAFFLKLAGVGSMDQLDTAWSKSPSGGFHVYYKLPINSGDVVTIRSRPMRSSPVPGVEFLCEGRMAVEWPSIHPSYDRPYQWNKGYIPDKERLAPLPTKAIWQLLRSIPDNKPTKRILPDPLTGHSMTTSSCSSVVERWIREMEETPKGFRHDKNLAVAISIGGFVAHGLIDENEAFTLICEAAQKAGRPAEKAHRDTEDGLRIGKTKPWLPGEQTN